MGTSIGLIISAPENNKTDLYLLFSAQLGLNFSWSLAFFVFQSPQTGLAVIMVLMALITTYYLRARQRHLIAAALLLPYIMWVGFAAYLNAYVFFNN